jgi:hypothetical protein
MAKCRRSATTATGANRPECKHPSAHAEACANRSVGYVGLPTLGGGRHRPCPALVKFKAHCDQI